MSKRPRPKRQQQLSLQEWMRQPTAYASRAEVLTVARMVTLKLIQLHEEQRRYNRWYMRLWAAWKRLFAPATAEVDLTEENVAPGPHLQDDGGEENAADDPRPAELATGKEEITEAGVKVIDKRGAR